MVLGLRNTKETKTMSRPRCRLLTGSVNHRSSGKTVRTYQRRGEPRPRTYTPASPGPKTDILASPALWSWSGDGLVLHHDAHAVVGVWAVVSYGGGSRWMWAVPEAASFGTATTLERARCAALAAAVGRLNRAERDAAIRRLTSHFPLRKSPRRVGRKRTGLAAVRRGPGRRPTDLPLTIFPW